MDIVSGEGEAFLTQLHAQLSSTLANFLLHIWVWQQMWKYRMKIVCDWDASVNRCSVTRKYFRQKSVSVVWIIQIIGWNHTGATQRHVNEWCDQDTCGRSKNFTQQYYLGHLYLVVISSLAELYIVFANYLSFKLEKSIGVKWVA